MTQHTNAPYRPADKPGSIRLSPQVGIGEVLAGGFKDGFRSFWTILLLPALIAATIAGLVSIAALLIWLLIYRNKVSHNLSVIFATDEGIDSFYWLVNMLTFGLVVVYCLIDTFLEAASVKASCRGLLGMKTGFVQAFEGFTDVWHKVLGFALIKGVVFGALVVAANFAFLELWMNKVLLAIVNAQRAQTGETANVSLELNLLIVGVLLLGVLSLAMWLLLAPLRSTTQIIVVEKAGPFKALARSWSLFRGEYKTCVWYQILPTILVFYPVYTLVLFGLMLSAMTSLIALLKLLGKHPLDEVFFSFLNLTWLLNTGTAFLAFFANMLIHLCLNYLYFRQIFSREGAHQKLLQIVHTHPATWPEFPLKHTQPTVAAAGDQADYYPGQPDAGQPHTGQPYPGQAGQPYPGQPGPH